MWLQYSCIVITCQEKNAFFPLPDCLNPWHTFWLIMGFRHLTQNSLHPSDEGWNCLSCWNYFSFRIYAMTSGAGLVFYTALTLIILTLCPTMGEMHPATVSNHFDVFFDHLLAVELKFYFVVGRPVGGLVIYMIFFFRHPKTSRKLHNYLRLSRFFGVWCFSPTHGIMECRRSRL